MNNTPPPVSAASAAARIRSGVGEVKTCPGQAASSMPGPTNPPCSGSWPEPPPDTRATLPGLRCRRSTKGAVSPSRTMSECAAQKPARLSLTTSSTALISFFMRPSPVMLPGDCSSGVLDQPCDLFGEFAQERVELVIFLFAAEIGQHQCEPPAPLAVFQKQQPPRMRAMIGVEKPLLLLHGEMADLHDRVHVLRGNWRLIGRVGDLGDEAAVLAERLGEPL